jgi:hypothetical protein
VAPSDAEGHKKGDLLATLDADLARRINEAAHRMTDCADGKKFDTAHGTRKRRGTASYGQALCAAEGVVGMAGKGGTFADLTLLSHEKVGIEFAATAVKAREALLVLTNFITAYGPMLAIPEELAGQLGTYILALVIDSFLVDNLPIGPINYIGPDLAVTYDAMSPRPTPTSTSATSTSSSSGCPDPAKTLVWMYYRLSTVFRLTFSHRYPVEKKERIAQLSFPIECPRRCRNLFVPT